MSDFKDYEKTKIDIKAFQWFGKLSDVPSEILDNYDIQFEYKTKILRIKFGNNEMFFGVNDYIAKDNGDYYKIPFKLFPGNYKEKNK